MEFAPLRSLTIVGSNRHSVVDNNSNNFLIQFHMISSSNIENEKLRLIFFSLALSISPVIHCVTIIVLYS